jgi:hypothetical protein
MEAVWVVPVTFRHQDGTDDATAVLTIEGSSRTTAVHDIMKIASADIPYFTPDAKFRAEIRRLNDSMDTGLIEGQAEILRCMRMPALILVGFLRQPGVITGFDAALRSLVALRHVDPPKPWGEGPENESLADEVLAEMHRQGLISERERWYLSGSCTRADARAAHLPDDPASRAARIVQVFANRDDRYKAAIRSAVTRQSTRKYIGEKLKNELATALILRASSFADADKADRTRRYLRHAFGKAVHRGVWEPTGRTHDALVADALREVAAALGAGRTDEPGPASLELAVRAAYPLIVSGQLTADRGTANSDQPDRRIPGEVLNRMRQSLHGIHQLGRALTDFDAGKPIRAVDETGAIRPLSNGSGDQVVSDASLRNEFSAAGSVRPSRSGRTPAEVVQDRLANFSEAIKELARAHKAVADVLGADGQSVVEADGVDPNHCADWRSVLGRINDDLSDWGRQFRRRYGTKAPPTLRDGDVDDILDATAEPNDTSEDDDSAYEGWDEKIDAVATA